jgi:hypothetical protein
MGAFVYCDWCVEDGNQIKEEAKHVKLQWGSDMIDLCDDHYAEYQEYKKNELEEKTT